MRLLSSIFSQNGLSYKMPTLKNKRAWILSYSVPTSWSSSCFLTKCHCDFYDGLTWLKWFLCKMRFTSLSYKLLDLDFMSWFAWLKWKPLEEEIWWFRGGATHPLRWSPSKRPAMLLPARNKNHIGNNNKINKHLYYIYIYTRNYMNMYYICIYVHTGVCIYICGRLMVYTCTYYKI